MKHESDESGIIVYDMHDDYSLGRSSKSNKTTDREEKKETATSNQKYANNELMALLGGFSGRVYDKLTYRTIEGASVTIAKDLSIKTDEKGIFTATGIKPGKYRITVFEEGYMIQSCRSTAVAGETTKLDSFHLIPDCLVAEYPDDIAKGEEETTEEGLVEFALEAPQPTLFEESTRSPEAENAIKEESVPKEAMSDGLSEQIAQVSSDNLVAEDIHTKIALDLEVLRDITEERTIEHLKEQTSTKNFMPPQGAGGEVFSTFEEISEEAADRYIDIVAAAVEERKEISSDEIIAVLLEQIQTTAIAESAAEAVISPAEEIIALIEEPSIAEISLASVEPVIAEAKQPEESLEKARKEAPWEITMEETPIEIAAEVLIQEEIGRVASQEAPVEPSAGEASQETTQPPEQQEQFLASSSEVGPETAVAEVVQPTETPQAPVGEKSRLGKLWKSLRTKIVKELELSQETSAEPADEAIQETTPPVEKEKQTLGHPRETASETATQEMISEKPHVEAQAITVTLEEMPVSTGSRESTETAVSVSEKTIVEDISSVDELSLLSIETGTAEAKQPEEVPEELFREEASVEDIVENGKEEAEKEIPLEEPLEPPIEVAPEITALEEFIEEVYEGEPLGPSVDVSLKLTAQEEALGEVQQEDPTVDVFLKGIPTLAMFADSAEVTMPAPEETIIGDIFLIDQLPHMFVETDIAEMTQPGEVLLEISEAESPVETTAEEMAQAEIVEDVYHEQPSEPSIEVVPEFTAREEVVEEAHKKESLEPPLDVALGLTAQEEIAEVTQPEGASHEVSSEVSREGHHEVPGEGSGSKLVWWTRRKRKTRSVDQEQPPEPSMGISSQIAPQEEVLGEAAQKESSLDVSVNKKTISIPAEITKTPVDATDSTTSVTSATERTVLESAPTVDEFPRMPIETGIVEITQPEEVPQNLSAKEALLEETPVENIVKETTQDRIKDGPRPKKLSVDISVEEVVKTPTVDENIDKIIAALDNGEVAADATSAEDSVAHEEALAGISDDDLASMSNEEKEALSHGHESVEVEGFIGIINAQPNPAYKGLPISIAYTLRNVSCDNPDDFIVQVYVVNPDTDIIYDTLEIPVKCSRGTFSMGGFVIFTTSYETYVYRLIMQIVSKKTKTPHLLTDIPLEVKSIY